MATDSDIGWTRKTLNPGVFGCEADGGECEDCYAEIMAWRQGNMAHARGETEGGYIGAATLTARGPRWTRAVRVEHSRVAPAFASLPRAVCAVFVTSMADLHHADVPDDFLELVYAEMERRPHWFQVLTKRPGNAAAFLQRSGRAGRLAPNIWIGTTAGDPKRAPHRLDDLARVPAPNLFVSMEPLLGAIDPRPWLGRELVSGGRIRWVIAGGKSGHHPVASDPSWFRLVRDSCRSAGVTFFFKPWGLYEPASPLDASESEMRRVRVVDPAPRLDGRLHLDFPPGWRP